MAELYEEWNKEEPVCFFPLISGADQVLYKKVGGRRYHSYPKSRDISEELKCIPIGTILKYASKIEDA